MPYIENTMLCWQRYSMLSGVAASDAQSYEWGLRLAIIPYSLIYLEFWCAQYAPGQRVDN